MKVKKALLKLTPEQREAVQPLYDALKEMAPTGLGMTIGQLGGEGSFTNFNFGFSTAGFAVLDHTATVKVMDLIKRELKRMAAAAEADPPVVQAGTELLTEAGN